MQEKPDLVPLPIRRGTSIEPSPHKLLDNYKSQTPARSVSLQIAKVYGPRARALLRNKKQTEDPNFRHKAWKGLARLSKNLKLFYRSLAVNPDKIQIQFVDTESE